MNILHINTHDRGGAANAVIRLHHGLICESINSNIIVRGKTNDISEKIHSYNKTTLQTELIRKTYNALGFLNNFNFINRYNRFYIYKQLKKIKKNRPLGLEIIHSPIGFYDITNSSLYKNADIIHLHWISEFLDWATFFKKNNKPVVWTIHDENPFSGYEHYEESFLGIDERGYPIPRLKSESEIFFNKKCINYKIDTISNNQNIHIVCPSKWIYDRSVSSQVLGRFSHHHIPNGFPTDKFYPMDQRICRNALKLPEDKVIILFVADDITLNQRKGFAYLNRALKTLPSKSNVFLCAIGEMDQSIDTRYIRSFGRINDENLLRMAYSAADVFVIPSLMDNLPNTMIESILCGTPVIGFPVGGIKEVIKNGENGFLCNEISVSSLSDTLEYFIRNSKIDRAKIANNASEMFNIKKSVHSYKDVYNKLLA